MVETIVTHIIKIRISLKLAARKQNGRPFRRPYQALTNTRRGRRCPILLQPLFQSRFLCASFRGEVGMSADSFPRVVSWVGIDSMIREF